LESWEKTTRWSGQARTAWIEAPGFSFVPVASPVVAGEAGVTVIELPGRHNKGVDSRFLQEVGCQREDQ
jgi:hypothetical protein